MNTKALYLTPFLLATFGAQAGEGTLEFYGILDVAYGTQSNGLPANASNPTSVVSTVYPNAANTNVGTQSGLWSGGLSQDRVGLKGSRSFDDGWTGGFLLESGINVVSGTLINNAAALASNASGKSNPSLGYTSIATNGSQNGQLFNREAYASLAREGWGEIRIGRNTSLIHDTAQQFDPTQASQVFGYLTSSSGFGGGVGISESTRLDNSVKVLERFGDIKLGLLYATGDNTGLAAQGHVASVSVGYDTAALKLQAAYSSETDALKESVDPSSTVVPLKTTAYNSQGWILASAYQINPNWSVRAGVSFYDLSTPNDSISSITSINGYATATASYAGSDITAHLYWLGGTYRATDRLSFFGGYYLGTFDGYTSGTYTATNGNVNWFSLVADYKLDDKSDVYVAAADISLTNTSSNSAITGATSAGTSYAPIANSTLFAVGYRYKF